MDTNGVQISTHSLTRRLTQSTIIDLHYRGNFNSQPHKEADHKSHKHRKNAHISTHSLTRRLTMLKSARSAGRNYFNSQPHKEADVRKLDHSRSFRYFNSQPHKEADLRIILDKLNNFISTHSLTRRLTSSRI